MVFRGGPKKCLPPVLHEKFMSHRLCFLDPLQREKVEVTKRQGPLQAQSKASRAINA